MDSGGGFEGLYQVTFRLGGWAAALLMASALVSCGRERPTPEPVTYREVKFKKVAVWVEKGNVLGQFGLVNENGKALAMAGWLTLSFHARSSVNVEGGSAFNVKSEIFQGVLPVKVADFHWIYYHSFLTDDDFVCKFKVPLSQLKNCPPGGRFIEFKISFKPDVYPSPIEEEKKLWLPEN